MVCTHVKDTDKPAELVLDRRLVDIEGGTNLVFTSSTPTATRRSEAEQEAEFWASQAEEKGIALAMFQEGKSIRAVSSCLEDSGFPASKSTVHRWWDTFRKFGDLPDSRNLAEH